MIDDIKEYRKELRKWYVEKKQKSKCAFCGKSGKGSKLQYHHVNPANKVDTVSNMVHECCEQWIIEKEMNKCIVLCRKCHEKWHKTYG